MAQKKACGMKRTAGSVMYGENEKTKYQKRKIKIASTRIIMASIFRVYMALALCARARRMDIGSGQWRNLNGAASVNGARKWQIIRTAKMKIGEKAAIGKCGGEKISSWTPRGRALEWLRAHARCLQWHWRGWTHYRGMALAPRTRAAKRARVLRFCRCARCRSAAKQNAGGSVAARIAQWYGAANECWNYGMRLRREMRASVRSMAQVL